MTMSDTAAALAAVAAEIPDFAKDLRLNLGTVMGSPNLTPQQAWGTAVAAAIAARNRRLGTAMAAAAERCLSPAALAAAKTAAALMGMNNVYYRFTHFPGLEAYGRMPARLRMQAIANPGIERIDFELWALAVSAVNGCAACVAAHERQVVEHGLTPDAVQDAVRIAAVICGIAVALEAAAV